jgi:hypothetical protein
VTLSGPGTAFAAPRLLGRGELQHEKIGGCGDAQRVSTGVEGASSRHGQLDADVLCRKPNGRSLGSRSGARARQLSLCGCRPSCVNPRVSFEGSAAGSKWYCTAPNDRTLSERRGESVATARPARCEVTPWWTITMHPRASGPRCAERDSFSLIGNLILSGAFNSRSSSGGSQRGTSSSWRWNTSRSARRSTGHGRRSRSRSCAPPAPSDRAGCSTTGSNTWSGSDFLRRSSGSALSCIEHASSLSPPRTRSARSMKPSRSPAPTPSRSSTCGRRASVSCWRFSDSVTCRANLRASAIDCWRSSWLPASSSFTSP